MSRTTMILLMFGVMAAATLRAWGVAADVSEDRADATEWFVSLMAVATVTQLILIANALGFISWVEIMALESPEKGSLVEQQLWLLLGTGALMALIAAAVGDRTVRKAPGPLEATSAALTAVVERLLLRFWWAALGCGVIFGVRARGVALLLAVELSVVWLVGKMIPRREPSDAEAPRTR